MGAAFGPFPPEPPRIADSRPLTYSCPVIFEWDETKSEACFHERGFDFAYAARAFFDPDRLVQADTRHSYGEERYRLMGKIEQRLFVVVYTPRHEAMRIISARKANQRELRQYENRTRKD
jgi:uncharacterized DUF497 family protein